jgi:hypothetical protein
MLAASSAAFFESSEPSSAMCICHGGQASYPPRITKRGHQAWWTSPSEPLLFVRSAAARAVRATSSEPSVADTLFGRK